MTAKEEIRELRARVKELEWEIQVLELRQQVLELQHPVYPIYPQPYWWPRSCAPWETTWTYSTHTTTNNITLDLMTLT